jgi:hypothetical protein
LKGNLERRTSVPGARPEIARRFNRQFGDFVLKLAGLHAFEPCQFVGPVELIGIHILLAEKALGNPPFIRYQNFPELSRSPAMDLMKEQGHTGGMGQGQDEGKTVGSSSLRINQLPVF